MLGVIKKPEHCIKNCKYHEIGRGFCPDFIGKTPKVAFLLEAPGPDEIVAREPLIGRSGKFWLKALVNPLGYTREDCIISNVLRCFPENMEYPSFPYRQPAEKACRYYDDKHGVNGKLFPGGIKDFNPNIFLLTYHPAAILRTKAYLKIVRSDVKKAFNFYEEGWRPCLLMGAKAGALFLPFIEGNGGLDNWHSHIWEGEFKGKTTTLTLHKRLI